MKFGFVTCVQLGLSCMEAIYDVGGNLELSITLHDDKAKAKSGRVYIDRFCYEKKIPLLKINNINDAEAVESIKKLDWLFIIGWSQIAGKDVLDAPTFGVLGMHPTLLPLGRGRASIPWAILHQLPETGVTLFKLDKGVDTGPIAARYVIPLNSSSDANSLYSAVSEAHIQLMKDSFPKLAKGTLELELQDDENSTEWPGRKPEDGKININGSVFDAERLIRAVTRPYPGAFLEMNDRRLIVWKASLEPTEFSKMTLPFSDGVLYCLDFEEVLVSYNSQSN